MYAKVGTEGHVTEGLGCLPLSCAWLAISRSSVPSVAAYRAVERSDHTSKK